MNECNEENIKKIKDSAKKDEYDGYEMETKIKGYDMSIYCNPEDYDEDEYEDPVEEAIKFAFALVDEYIANKDKYDKQALETVKDCLKEQGDELDDDSIMDQLGEPLMSVDMINHASLWYGGIEELGEHAPEVRVDRYDGEFEVSDVALNG